MLALVSALGHRSVAAVVGHDFGSPVAAWCALTAPRRVSLGGDDERAVRRRAGASRSTRRTGRRAVHASRPHDRRGSRGAAPPRKHYQCYYTTRDANENMWHAPQGCTPSCAPTTTRRARTGRGTAASAGRVQRRRARQAAALLRHGSGQGHGREGGRRHALASGDRRVPVAHR